ncbi:MAG: hypothetical protein SOW21_09040 [[Actinobacillus] rossii]|uniref:Uncharacterized protein n=1 Tax=[Actinobacillus] rossii TaxID=123820 RepID=A0A380U1Y4_9PAST|nr:hypothetical protein [[Actinobacillus] rossii]SUT94542.1 Uncharacterised protein [[Actinobacillus] rossii]
MNWLVDVIVKVISIFAFMFIALVFFVILSNIGWLKVIAAVAVFLIVFSIIIYYTSKGPTPTLEDERIAQLNQEVSRPIIQATLAKQANETIDLGQIIKGKATFTDKNGNKQDLDIAVNLKLK